MPDIAFATSGSTGPPVTWLRTEEQLHAEVTLVHEAVLDSARFGRVVSYAPPGHLYGRLYGRELPRLADVPVTGLWDEPLTVPPLDDGVPTLLVCLPSTWQLLARHVPALARHGRVTALHSTGPATPAAHHVAGRLADTGFRAHELLGSTETGAVAHRPVAGERTTGLPWRLLPDVEMLPGSVADGDGAARRLRVASPRLARRAGAEAPTADWELPDLVAPAGPRAFQHLGRASRLVKVNGVRCDLAHVEDLARARCPGLDLVCAPVSDPVRGEHYEVFYASAEPVDPAALRRSLGRLPSGLPAPRAVHRVPRIPRSSTGKVRTAELTAARPTQEAEHV
ncbi:MULTISPECIES: acyl-CoA synthetase [Streptomyces]|uniref:4-coumarate-CoA ligase n=1 Tax=Streptomyces chartreusis NRRL 3882 TaxID=1079985 RepID=A0A2N9BJ26_STRCX|nr:acyl-CoA synthetase [Streptomyces chartreusis]MYS95152.1 acyl-CoA synthetase [Streptomyces sp. SID5464]SOR83356.1 4-coumarate-CoA ligase [Streptomyces chartreusis NRRL 3882]